jgi:hypothetical protein
VRTFRAGLDIKLLGSLFFAVGLVDLLVIEIFPGYALKLFGVVIPASLAYPVKMHSPAVHFFIGYGFVFLRPWAWGLAMAYGGFGLVSELMNQLTFGFHPLRSGFMGATLMFMGFLLWRRHLFTHTSFHDPSIRTTSEELR